MISGRRFQALFVCSALFLIFTVIASAQGSPVRQLGTVKSISNGTFVLAPDAGPDVHVSVSPEARVLRIEPGQTDLKTAVPMPLEQLQKGDRVLVRGSMAEDGKTLQASMLVAVKKEDLAQKQERELQDWRKRGTGGLVQSVDPAKGDVTISTMTPTGVKPIVIHTSSKTVLRRYAQDSVKFDDAKPGKFDEIKVGDQLRARGTKNPDGTELSADEIVFGTFRNIAGVITAVDAQAKTITVNDLLSKKPVVVHVAQTTEMHKLPEMLAQRLAMRLKGQNGGENGQGAPEGQRQASDANARPQGQAPAGPPRNAMGTPGGRNVDLAQMLNRMPPMPFEEMIKGDAVMIVSTVGTPTDVSAITLLNGVEPILTASPEGGTLTPWSLGSLGSEPGGAAQ